MSILLLLLLLKLAQVLDSPNRLGLANARRTILSWLYLSPADMTVGRR
jgi:hypothetical protein